MAKNSKFGAAFKAAKASGKKEFSFGGKKYNTKEAPALPKKGPNPGPGRPATMSEKKAYMSQVEKAVTALKSPTKPLPEKSGTGTAAKKAGVGRGTHGASEVKARVGFDTSKPATSAQKAHVARTADAARRKASSDKGRSDAAKKAAMGPPAPSTVQAGSNKSTVGKSPIAVKNQANKKK